MRIGSFSISFGAALISMIFAFPISKAANPVESAAAQVTDAEAAQQIPRQDSGQADENPCLLKDKLEALKALKDASLVGTELATSTDATSTIPQDPELTLLKDILTNVVFCAAREAEELLAAVRTIPLVGKNEQDVQRTIAESIERALRTYQAFSDDIAALETVEGTKAHAVQIAKWRESRYFALSETARNFIIWTDNQNMLEKARTRLFQIKQSIVSLRLTQHETVQLSFERARTFLLRADDEHLRARQSIERGEASDRSLDHLKRSLGELYKAYGAFLEVTDVMRKALQG